MRFLSKDQFHLQKTCQLTFMYGFKSVFYKNLCKILVHQCVRVKCPSRLCLLLIVWSVGGPQTCSSELIPYILMNTDVQSPLWLNKTSQGHSRAISRLRDGQRRSQNRSSTVTSAQIAVTEDVVGDHVTNQLQQERSCGSGRCLKSQAKEKCLTQL